MEKTKVIGFLKDLGDVYVKLGDGTRASSFIRAATAINESIVETAINDVSEINDIHGVGASTKQEVREYLQKGTSERFEKLKKQLEESTNSLESKTKMLNSLTKLHKLGLKK